MGLCLMAVCAMFALTATVASAENLPHFGFCKAQAGGKYKSSGCTKLAKTAEEEKFEWSALATTVAFTSAKEKETGPAVLEAASGTEISCTAQVQKQGEYGPGDQVKNIIGEFAGCKALGGSCNSPGKAAEHIDTLLLHGEPGVVTYNPTKSEKNIAGSDLRGEGSEFLAEFSCAAAPVKVKGGIVVKAQNFGSSGFAGLQTNKMQNKAKIAFISEKVAKQVPEKWVPNGGGITHTAAEHKPTEPINEHLEASLAGGAYEASGQFLRTLQKSTGGVKLELMMCEEKGKNAIVC